MKTKKRIIVRGLNVNCGGQYNIDNIKETEKSIIISGTMQTLNTWYQGTIAKHALNYNTTQQYSRDVIVDEFLSGYYNQYN